MKKLLVLLAVVAMLAVSVPAIAGNFTWSFTGLNGNNSGSSQSLTGIFGTYVNAFAFSAGGAYSWDNGLAGGANTWSLSIAKGIALGKFTTCDFNLKDGPSFSAIGGIEATSLAQAFYSGSFNKDIFKFSWKVYTPIF